MKFNTISNCPVCNETEFKTYLSCIDYTVSQERFTLKRCTKCGLVITDPRPEEAALPGYYLSDKYISHTGGNNTFIDKIYLMARKITLGWKRKLVENNTSQESILDIGCGTGEFLSGMKTHGWNISGVEPSSTARESAEKKTGIKIYEALSEVQEKKFTAITLWHVLEHLPDPNQAIQTMKGLLKDSGTIFIAVPNLQSYDGQYYNSYWAGYDVPRHLWHFNKENMKMLMEKNGFRLTKIVPMRLDSFYVSILSEAYKHPQRSKFFNYVIAFFVGLQSNLMARKSIEYSSHIYVVKR